MRQRASLQAKFDARLAKRLQDELGYTVEHVRYIQSGRLKNGWEIQGIGRDTIEKFSRRTGLIEAFAKQHGITDAEKKGQLGKLTREAKNEGESIEKLMAEWASRLSPAEKAVFKQLTQQSNHNKAENEKERVEASVNYAVEHHLYRQSTVERHQIVGTALEHGLTHTPEHVEQAIDRMDLIRRTIDVNGSRQQMVTTREVLNAERRMIAFARDGRGTRKAICSTEHEFFRDWLNDHQKAAVEYVLQSRDTVMAIVGGAGTGKSSLMEEAAEAIGKQNKQVFTFAPSTGAKEVLEEKGFENAQTVEHLIRNTSLHPKLADQVIWIDEAGLLDVRSMNAVFDIAKEQNARVVLSGDTRQHASPRRGEAMRLLENEAGLHIARAEKIQRQQGDYRRAIALVSKGHEVVNQHTGETGLLAGFDMLDAMGKIKEVDHEERYVKLAETYRELSSKGKSTLIVAPTHAEASSATDEIRSQLQSEGKLSKDEKYVKQYQSLNLSDAQKGKVETYLFKSDLIVQFHQNTKGGIKRGDRFHIAAIKGNVVELQSVGGKQKKFLPLDAADRFDVYTEKQLRIAAGDKVRFTLGGTTKNRQNRLSNGRLDEVKGFDKRGNMILKNGWVVNRDFAHVDLGYVITSHASQGKDCQVAIAAMGSQSLPAINAKQFYVTASRGKEDVVFFVDDKEKVRQAIQRSGEQMSATAMVKAANAQKAREGRDEPSVHLARQRRDAARSFRNRSLQKWRDVRDARSTRQTTRQTIAQQVGRHRQADGGRTMETGRAPGMERSR